MVLARAANQKPGETRLDLTYENAAIWCQTIPELVKHNRSTILLIATNPGMLSPTQPGGCQVR